MNRSLVILTVLLSASLVMAAPGLDIRKPPVVSGSNPYTGPLVDTFSTQGQWFVEPNTGAEFPLPHEFYDNHDPNYGGGWNSTNAITGKVVSVFAPGGNIVAFSIMATITDDTPALSDWANGSNRHGETLDANDQYYCTLYEPVLTAEFAIRGLGMLPPSFPDPYQDRQPYIIATNADLGAWYCWTPGYADPNDPSGGYYVPAWRFDDIPHGESRSRELTFMVDGAGIDPNDTRYGVIYDSYYYSTDVFSNRTTSLKISRWIDMLAADPGTAYPTPPQLSSDVSVFFVPEPATLAMLALGAGALLRRRRSR